MANFNPRSREGSDNITFFKFSILNINFNPRSREGSDGISCRIFGFYYFISIHAPARGATQHHHYILSQDMEISIHAPARGATRLFSGKFFAIFNFNPRSREGSDPLSVHRPHHLSAFQSTLPRGERPVARFTDFTTSLFQSTLPRGERHSGGPEFRTR